MASTFSSATFTSISTLFCFCMFCINATTNKEFILMGQSLGTSDTIVSYGGNFELGFFSRIRDSTTKYYIGIWFKKVPHDKVVWVANRDYAVQTSSAVLTIHSDGNIVIIDGPMMYHVNNVSNNFSTYATLLDSGNLVLLNNSNKAVLWQSFDYPTDTLLPGMNLGHDAALGYTWSLRSWTSANDPAPGAFSLEYDFGRASLIVNKGSNVFWIDDHSNVTIESVINRIGAVMNNLDYWTWPADSNSRLVLEVSGELNEEFWSEEAKRWVSLQSSKCGTNNSCGVFSICNPQALHPCDCLHGFKPFDIDSWRKGNKSAGCVRKTDLSCRNSSSNDGFLQFNEVELPPTLDGYSEKTKTNMAKECESNCSRNCSCVAYAYDLNGNCQLWLGEVLSLKNISTYEDKFYNTNPSFYLRLAASELILTESNTTNGKEPMNDFHKHENRRRDLLLIVILISFLTFLILGLFVYWTRRQRRKGEDLLHFDVGMSMKITDSELSETDKGVKVKKKEVKLPLFSFVSVSAATDNFSDANKLGEGGFGPVYKGKLLNGDEVAVKRLSRRSGQGWEELRNEALLIAKLQHNNLVRLLGCCIDRDEKMLIYEFMPNKSLDFFLFDATKRRMLDWGTRVRIIDGIAQGLIYLHQYSRFRIIHRDLKASNILLDINMNPKISDFGMARIFGENELEANTNRIVGTYGYMSPEYAMEGLFSIKSDVFSFGVLLLEIVHGKKNTGLYQTNSFNLLGYAWDHWRSNQGIELMDSTLEDTSSTHVVPRYVNIGLLCVQESPADRPTMADVVSMIGNEFVALPCPKPPAFLNLRGDENSRFSRNMPENFSVNGITDSLVEAR
ncbi:receptor-like serine/threonine-protein kinase SD1-8 [Abrus precatorius]|uniref:Receptor-like serine/threonine-protein kinase n=1 Tax=Abrus precatorius TaxID=3816 RepID=A0A8B8LMP8_ABRPR|nr:receptor-like serine/threonine-protein kinase SD1-8 [Abrus precatorius]